jgi:hypothetical protein
VVWGVECIVSIQKAQATRPFLRSERSTERTYLHQVLPPKAQRNKRVSSVIFLTRDSVCTLTLSLNVAESLRQPPSEFLILSFLSKGRRRPYVFSYEWCTEYNSFRSADSRSRRGCADVDS